MTYYTAIRNWSQITLYANIGVHYDILITDRNKWKNSVCRVTYDHVTQNLHGKNLEDGQLSVLGEDMGCFWEFHFPHIIFECLNFFKWAWIALVVGETGFTKTRDEKSDMNIESVFTLTSRVAVAKWSQKRLQLLCGRQPSGHSQASLSVLGHP